MSQGNVLVELGPFTARVIISRPQALNALDEATLGELESAFGALSREPMLRCAILTGAGEKAFVAGADIAAMASLEPREAQAFAERGHRLASLMEALPVPVVAAVNGFALGGGLELALACDFILAAREAKLGLPEVSLGVIPGFGGTQRLARRIGLARARQLVYTGEAITAGEALAIGLVNEVVDRADLAGRAQALADKIATRGPLAVAAAKRALRDGAELPLGPALALERDLFAGLFASADQKEGMRAFLEKRPPRFQGK